MAMSRLLAGLRHSPNYLAKLRAELPAGSLASPAGNVETYTREPRRVTEAWRDYCAAAADDADIA